MKRKLVLLIAGIPLLLNSCSLTTLAMRSSNPEFIGKHIPGILEKNETKLEKNPGDQALIFETGSLYVMYANAFVQGPSDMLPPHEFDKREAASAEAKKNYLRGVEILNTGLEKKFTGYLEAFNANNAEKMSAVISNAVQDDTAYFYWTVAGTLSAYSLDPFDFVLGLKIPVLKVMIDKAYELDPGFNLGAIDDFYVLFYASLPEGIGGDKTKVGEHYRLAVEKSKGLLAGPYISYAEAVAIPNQDYEAFKNNLDKALAINPNKDKDNRLVNTINQRKARYLLDKAEDLFAGLGEEWIYDDDEVNFEDNADNNEGEE
jgi:predicted anti-sigma-YlaC factor YlaD